MFGELVVQMAVGRTRHEIDRRPVRNTYPLDDKKTSRDEYLRIYHNNILYLPTETTV